MMNNTLIFLRHGSTLMNPETPAASWILSEEGKKEVVELVQTGVFDDINIIISSDEQKAIQTAKPLADRLHKKVILEKNFRELERGTASIKEKQDYNRVVMRIFEDKEYSYQTWETAINTLKRFNKGLEKIERNYSDSKILVISHRIILSLYFAELLRTPDTEIFNRWKLLRFCAWGIVRKKKILKDII